MEGKRPEEPPRVEERVEIGWRKGLEKIEEKKEESEEKGEKGVTVRKKQRSPVEKKKEKEKERGRPQSTESDTEDESGEKLPDSAKKPRAPRGLKKRVEEMSEERLRSELRCVGVQAGPIGKGGVRKGYEKKLIEALVVEGDDKKMKGIIDGVAPPSTSSSKTPSRATPSSATKAGGGRRADVKTAVANALLYSLAGLKFSRPLELAMGGRNWQEGVAQALDESLRSYFINKGISAFCYLLIDPRLLPANPSEWTLQLLIAASESGRKARPHQHLIDARNARDNKTGKLSDKILRILDIWASGAGVISLQLSLDICDEEAFTREASLIDAVGVCNLTNEKGGTYYGSAIQWQLQQKAQLGTLMLKRVWSTIRNDPSVIKPIRPEALPEYLFKPFGGGARKQPVTSSATIQSKPVPPPPGLMNRLRA
ncbi:hypothetical protein PENTCL1PPCAC_22230, partial [Pristionchus entomophagus]